MLIGDDTDLLVLLCHHADIDAHELYFKSEPKKNAKTIGRVWNIKKMKEQLWSDICNNIPFAHAFLGCDSTSSLFGIGKGAAMKKITNSHFHEQALQVFSQDIANVCADDIIAAGEKALVSMYKQRQ